MTEVLKFSIQRSELLKSLRLLSGVFDKKIDKNPEFSCVWLAVMAQHNQGKIVALDHDVHIICDIEIVNCSQDLKVLLPGRKLYDICRVLADSDLLMFELSAGTVNIAVNTSRYALQTLVDHDFPDFAAKMQKQSSVNIDSKVFKKMLEKTAFAMADQDVRYFFNGVLLKFFANNISMVASDGHRLSVNDYLIQTQGEEGSCIIPRKTVLELLRIIEPQDNSFVCVELGSNGILVKTKEFEMFSRILDGNFPDYKQLLAGNKDVNIVGDKEQLKQAFYRASILFSDKFKAVKVCFVNGVMRIQACTQDQDKIEEEIAVDYHDEPLEVGFNCRYLLDFLNISNSHLINIALSKNNGPVLLSEVADHACTCVLMPVQF